MHIFVPRNKCTKISPCHICFVEPDARCPVGSDAPQNHMHPYWSDSLLKPGQMPMLRKDPLLNIYKFVTRCSNFRLV